MFSECGGREATLILYEVSNFVLDSVTIQNSTGTGLAGFNFRGSLIHHSDNRWPPAFETAVRSCSVHCY